MGKFVTCAKRGKTCNLRPTRENMQPAPSTGKHVTGTRRGKIRKQRKYNL